MTAGDNRALRQHLRRLLRQPDDQARALPGAFYTDPSWLAAEISELFAVQWVCLGRREEIPEPGDYFTAEVAGEPVIILRGQDGAPRALANICRHRGTVLAEGAGRLKRLVCPYHHWSYDLQGNLLCAPGMDPPGPPRAEDARLRQLPLAEWMGFLFVSLADEPPDLPATLAPLAGRIRNYHLEEMHLRHLETETWDINWKCLFENFMEGYHLSPLHRKTLHRVNPTRLCRHFPAGDGYLGYTVGFTERVGEGTAGHPDLSEEERNTCVMFAVPPGLVVGVGSDYSSFICLQPDGVERVRARMGLFFFGDGWTGAALEDAVRLFRETMAEDKAVLLRLQRGLRSRHYEPGPLAQPDLEGTCRDLHRYLAKHMAGDPAVQAPPGSPGEGGVP